MLFRASDLWGHRRQVRLGSKFRELKAYLRVQIPLALLFTQAKYECLCGNMYAIGVAPLQAKHACHRSPLADTQGLENRVRSGLLNAHVALWFSESPVSGWKSRIDTCCWLACTLRHG